MPVINRCLNCRIILGCYIGGVRFSCTESCISCAVPKQPHTIRHGFCYNCLQLVRKSIQTEGAEKCGTYRTKKN